MSERNKAIAELYKTGKTFQEIGEQYELTGERVRQIVKSIGIYRNQGGAYIKSKARMDASEKKRLQSWDKRSFKKYGCSYEEVKRISGGRLSDGIARNYINQRNSSMQRGIEWSISFPDWVDAWKSSGNWNNRGCSEDGYCLARKDFTVGFTKDNVVVEKLSKLVTRTRNFYK